MQIVLTNKGQNGSINTRNNSFQIKRKRGSNPLEISECIIQYVSGMANVTTCDESLYHRL